MILTNHHSWAVLNEGRIRNYHTIRNPGNHRGNTGYHGTCLLKTLTKWRYYMESKENKDRVTFTIDPELHRQLKRLMIKRDRTKAWLICHAIKILLEMQNN